MKAAVAIVEDHPMFRERLAELINKERDLQVCGESDNIRDGFTLIMERGAQVAIIDLTLQNSNGLELLKNLKAAGSNVPVLVLSMHDEALYAERALRAGARGYITKNQASANVMTALRQVLSRRDLSRDQSGHENPHQHFRRRRATPHGRRTPD